MNDGTNLEPNRERAIATALRSAGREPDEHQVDRLRQRLVDELRSPGSAHLAVAPPPPGRRRPLTGPIARVGLAAAAVAAVIAGIAVVVGGDGADERLRTSTPASTATVTDPPSTPSTEPTPSTAPTPSTSVLPGSFLDHLDGTRWALASVDGTPWERAELPWGRFERDADGTLRFLAWDGCNGGNGVVSEAGVIDEYASTLIGCTPPGVSFRGQLQPLGDALVITSPTQTLQFAALDGPATPGQLVGRWAVTFGGAEAAITFGERVVTVGSCELSWELAGGRLTLAAAPDAFCAEPFGQALAALGDQIDAQVDGDTLRLVGDLRALALTRAGGVQPPPESENPGTETPTVTLERGALVGYRPQILPGDDPAVVDEVVAAISERLGPVTFDTGRFTVPDELPSCVAGLDLRVLWWGGVSVAFIVADDSAVLYNWTVGNPEAIGNMARGDERNRSTPSPDDSADNSSDLLTELGIGVGSTEAEFLAAYPDRFIAADRDGAGESHYFSDSTSWPESDFTYALSVLVRGGAVAGYAATLSVC